nr:MAG TPA: hypothetical protein [Bacteriophage sp.]
MRKQCRDKITKGRESSTSMIPRRISKPYLIFC